MITTAEDLIFSILSSCNHDSEVEYLQSNKGKDLLDSLVEEVNERTKLHVKAALIAASENVRTTCLADRFLDGYDSEEDSEGNIFYKQSILDAYPETLIQ